MSETRKKASPASRLLAAMDACAVARGEAQWTNGYRAAKGAEHDATSEGDRLWKREQAHWREVERTEAAFRRLTQRILAEARS